MANTLSTILRDKIIVKLLLNQNHRTVIQTEIDKQFFKQIMTFFKEIVDAKLNDTKITQDWYRHIMLSDKLDKDQIAWNSGLSLKSISNIHGSQDKKIVITASNQHYTELMQSLDELIANDPMDITLAISIKDVQIKLTIHESLIVINAIAVMRAGLRGGMWSTVGKQVEKPLMITLCKLLSIDPRHYSSQSVDTTSHSREFDFLFINSKKEKKYCEVKLMGRGNPESADGALARNIDIFVADKLSDLNKSELNKLGIVWIALADDEILAKFAKAMTKIGIIVDSKNISTEINEVGILDILKNV